MIPFQAPRLNERSSCAKSWGTSAKGVECRSNRGDCDTSAPSFVGVLSQRWDLPVMVCICPIAYDRLRERLGRTRWWGIQRAKGCNREYCGMGRKEGE